MQNDSTRLPVLLINDSPLVQAYVQELLGADGHRVVVAETPRDALSRGDLSSFPVILLDRRSADVCSDDFLSSMGHEASEHACVVLFSSNEMIGTDYGRLRLPLNCRPRTVEAESVRSIVRHIAELARERTQRFETQRKLLQCQRLAAIGQTVASVSHEARAELHAVRMGLLLLPEVIDDRETASEIIRHLSTCEHRLSRLLDDVREFTSSIHLESAACDLRNIWRQAWASIESKRRGRDVALREMVKCDRPFLAADAFRLEQVFRNLFENSLSACSDPVVIRIECDQVSDANQSFVLRIGDNGPGLSDEQKDRIFEAFYTTNPHGTGLGMAIVKRIIQAHGGTIHVAEDALPGLEFIVALPIAHETPAARRSRKAAAN